MDLKTLANTPPWDWPSGASNVLVDVLLDKRATPDDRLLAAKLAGDCTVVDDTIADVLLSIVDDAIEPAELRATAAVSLGPAFELVDTMGFGDPDAPLSEGKYKQAQAKLNDLFLDPSQPKLLRRSVLEGSVRGVQSWHTTAIKQAYASDDPEWRLTAVFCMQYVGGFDACILESLESEDLSIQQAAAEAAGFWEIDGAWDRLCMLLESSPDESVRIAALESIACVRPQDAEFLLSAYADDPNEQIALAARNALFNLDGPATGRTSIPDELAN